MNPATTSNKFLEFKLQPWGVLSAAGSSICLASLTGFIGQYWWLLDLTSHFRVQYFLLLFGIAVGFGTVRKYQQAAVFAIFSLINLFVIIPGYIYPNVGKQSARQHFRALLLNVNTNNENYDLVEKLIEKNDPDIIVLEEVDSAWIRSLSGIQKDYPYSIIRARGDNFGIALFSRSPLKTADIAYIGKADVPSIVTRMQVGTSTLTILATHPLPPVGAGYAHLRDDQLSSLSETIREIEKPVIVLGDLNTTPWSFHFRDLLKESGLSDSCRGYGIQGTWPSFFFPLRIPIDHCLHSSEVTILNRKIGSDVGSDHLPLIVDFTLGNLTKVANFGR